MGGTKLLVVATALTLPLFSGCLDAAQEAFGVDGDVEFEVELSATEIELTYALVPDDTGAYQFQVPPGVDALVLESAEEQREAKHDSSSDGEYEYEPEEPHAEDSEDAAATDAFALFTAAGDRIDPVREYDETGEEADAEFRYRVDDPDAGAYVLVLHDTVDVPIQLRLEATRSERLDAAPFHAALLPLSPVAPRTLLVDRQATDAERLSGTIDLPFAASGFMFTVTGAGTSFHGTISSRAGLVYEETGGFLVAGGGDGGLLGATPGSSYGGAVDRENLEGTAYTWELVTDLVGKVHLTAFTFQPAPEATVGTTVETMGADEDHWHGAHGRSDLLDTTGEAEEHFYTGDAAYGDGAQIFTVPSDAQALLLVGTEEGGCDPWTAPGCGAASTKVSLFDATGARVGLFALAEDERLRLDAIEEGDYALYVHSGSLTVTVGVVGPPPASARLHEQKLVTLATETVGLTRTGPAEVTMAVEGIPLDLVLEEECLGGDRGFEFSAVARSPQGVAYEAFPSPGLWLPGLGCFQGPHEGGAIPEALVPGAYTLTVEATGGVGNVVAKVLGLPSIGDLRHRSDEDHDGGDGNETAPPPLPPLALADRESLIG